MTTTIDFDKYSNMSRRQLISALDNAEKKNQKIKATYEQNLNNNLQLIEFLKSKIKESLNEPKYYTIENCPAFINNKEWEKEHPQEAQKARAELESEMQGYQNGD